MPSYAGEFLPIAHQLMVVFDAAALYLPKLQMRKQMMILRYCITLSIL